MPWNTPTAEQVTANRMTPQEVAALNAIQGSSSILQNLMADKVSQVRSMIRGSGAQLDQDGTLPDGVIPPVMDIVRWEWISSFPGLKMMLTDARKGAMERAEAFLQKVAAGTIRVELPAVGQAQAVAGPRGQIQVANTTTRQFTREKLKGL